MTHAKEYAAQEGVHLEQIAVVDATRVTQHEVFGLDRYDLILCQGPFYHLLHDYERQKLLQECAAMCKPGGYVLAAFVTKYAHLRDIAMRDPERLVREAHFYGQYVRDGVYDRIANRTSYHVLTEDIYKLFESAFSDVGGATRLQVKGLWACESFLGGELSKNLSALNPEGLAEWVKLCVAQADKPEMLGAADHLLVVARKG